MAVIAPENPTLTGLAATAHAAAAGGDQVPADGRTVVRVINGSTAAITATVVTPGTVPTGAIPDAVCTVPAGAARYVGPFSSELFGNAQSRADITWSATATVTFECIRY
jgi:hypothetical protein